MSIFQEYVFPAASNNSIATLQNADNDFIMQLNGRLKQPYKPGIDFINDYGFVPRITFTSAADMSAVSFLIIGYQNNIRIEETIVGPNTNTVTSVNCFDSINCFNSINCFASVNCFYSFNCFASSYPNYCSLR